MSDIKDYADQLQRDVVADMAEAYFGARRDLEDMLVAFDNMVDEFRPMVDRLSRAAATLHFLLLDSATARDFYISLDVMPSCIPLEICNAANGLDKTPFAFTRRGKYSKCVIQAYQHFQIVSDEYLNGRYFTDSKRYGRKRLTVHYLRLRALAGHINDEIRKVNEDVSTTAILRHVKGMDPVQSAKERIMGDVCLVEGCELDRDMCFTPLNFDGLGLPLVQDLPSLREVKGAIKVFCHELYGSCKSDVVRVLDEVVRSH